MGNMEERQSEKMDKDNDHVTDKQRARGDAKWGHRPHATLPPSLATCQSPNLLTQQQIEGGQGCKILATTPRGQSTGQVKVQLMIQKIPYILQEGYVQYYGTPELRFLWLHINMRERRDLKVVLLPSKYEEWDQATRTSQRCNTESC